MVNQWWFSIAFVGSTGRSSRCCCCCRWMINTHTELAWETLLWWMWHTLMRIWDAIVEIRKQQLLVVVESEQSLWVFLRSLTIMACTTASYQNNRKVAMMQVFRSLTRLLDWLMVQARAKIRRKKDQSRPPGLQIYLKKFRDYLGTRRSHSH